MDRNDKVCFVIMGFGKKTDFKTGKTLDLDQTYKNVIQPAAQESGYRCVRADEVQSSALIDKAMYALLIKSDLVIADISTFNPNAIYELGVRHAVRPFSTIVIKEDGGTIPFDLDHTNILQYRHLGEDIGADEARRCKNSLIKTINNISSNTIIDSPLYEFIKDINPPQITEEEYQSIVGELAAQEDQIFAIVEKAKYHMKKDEFVEAKELWARASTAMPSEDFFVQQQALATYKSKQPSEAMALNDALTIIEPLLNGGDTNDPETLGLIGAIYKRMWSVNEDVEFLNRAISYYQKGFEVNNDYYTGENFALCLNMLANSESEGDEKTYHLVAARKTREKIISTLQYVEQAADDNSHSSDQKWSLATLSNCYFGIGKDEEGEKYQTLFLELAEAKWESDTFFEAKEQLFSLTR